MTTRQWISHSADDLGAIAQEFITAIGSERLFALRGSMGAGKTTFVRAVCRALGITDVVNSPTFAIINQYSDPAGRPVYHFDFYRINRLEEAYDFGYEEYLYSDALCFIEWPELIEPLLPDAYAELKIDLQDDDSRLITLTLP